MKISYSKLATELGITAVKLSDQLSTRVEIEEETLQNILNILGIDVISETEMEGTGRIKIDLNKVQTRVLLYFIRGLIKDRGMTIINLSQHLDMDPAIVSDILYFRKSISEKFIRELSQFLPLTEDLLNEEDLLRLLDNHGYIYNLKESTVVVTKDSYKKTNKLVG